jgi:PAS domain S-box-containing protein
MTEIRRSEDVRELRRTIRDLVALMALPAAWVGRAPQQIAQGLASLLVSVLRLDAVFVRLNCAAGPAICSQLSGDWRVFADWIEKEGAQLGAGMGLPIERRIELPTSRGPLTVVVTPVGMDAEAGLVVTAAQRPDFPAELETLLLSVAANQAMISFQTSTLLLARAEAEEALRQSEQEFRALANSIPQLAWMTKPDGWIFWYNQRWYEYTGTTSGQMEGWGWQSVHDPAILPAVLQRWRDCVQTGHPFEMEFPLRGADGIYRWFLTRVVPLSDSAGKPLRWFGTSTNIHEQRQIRVALQQSEERLHAALAASDTGTFRWNPDTGEFLEFDDNLKRLFGFAAADSVRSTEDFMARVHPDDVSRVTAAVNACRGGTDFAMEFRVVLPDGSVRWLYDRAKMESQDGQAAYLVGACTDITARKVAEQALLQTEKLASVGRLAATVAHEINNPLEAVTNYIYLAKKNPQLPPKARQHLEIADQELARVSHIAQQTLGFYRDSSRPAWLEISRIVDDVLRVYERKIAYKQLQIRRDTDSKLMIYAVQGDLKQVLSNLISNAIEASREGGHIWVRAQHGREWKNGCSAGIRITIADNGVGIAPEAARKLFTPFFTTKNKLGTGLGLWITKTIVEKHGGSIRFRSRPNLGTIMSLNLPQNTRAETHEQAM